MKSPFKFLDSYTKEDRNIFFGREREIEELYHRVFESKLMLVYGISGTGKSSLIHCGLANKFNETDWLPLVIRRGNSVLESITSSIRGASITKQIEDIVAPAQFKKSVRSLYLDHYKPIYFIFDQFEELFIFGNKDERKAFAQIIRTLVDSDIQCRFIFVMREEYMAGITEFEKTLPTIFSNRVRVEKMSHNNALQAIDGPCNIFGIKVEEGFAEMLLKRLCPENTDVELTYLQVFLDKIFNLAQSDQMGESNELSFTSDLLNKTGNVTDILGSFLDEQISLLNDPETGLAVLKSFVSIKGTKKQISQQEVSEFSQTINNHTNESVIQELILTFINLRILHEKDQNGKYELRHDALATKIYEKITLVEKEILEIHQFLENAWNNWERRKLLLSSEDLLYIAPWESRLYLSKDLNTLVENSKLRILKNKQRKRRSILVSITCLVITLSAFSVWALNERKNAVKQQNLARESEKLAIEARNQAVASEINANKAKELAEKELYESVKNTWTITADRMNVFYLGVDNPVRITATGINADKIFPSSNNGKIRRGLNDFKVSPERVGECIISVIGVDAKGDTLCLGNRNFRVNNFPTPRARIVGKSEGEINKMDLMKAQTVDINYDMDFSIDTSKTKVSDFIILFSQFGSDYEEFAKSNKITTRQKALFSRLNHGQFLIINDIHATNQFGKKIELEPIILKIIDQNIIRQQEKWKDDYFKLIYNNDSMDPSIFELRKKIFETRDKKLINSITDSIRIYWYTNKPTLTRMNLEKCTKILEELKYFEEESHSIDPANASYDEYSTSLCYYDLYRCKPDSDLFRAINKNFEDWESSNDVQDLFNTLIFFANSIDFHDSIFYELGVEKHIKSVSEKLIKLAPVDNQSRSRVAPFCNNIANSFLRNKKFKSSLDMVQLAIKADSTYQYNYTTLPLAYLLNNNYESAMSEYKKWKDKPWLVDNKFKTFMDVFLLDISDLENIGFNIPDFQKVKELLKN